MYQHPVPQNVTSYQFRLIGDMTIRQFAELALGFGVGFLIYITNLYDPVKYVLIGCSVFAGIAFAFLPIEERPLDQWFMAFIRAIYRPTQFIWKKTPASPAYFNYTHSAQHSNDSQVIDHALRQKQEGLSSFIQTLPQDSMTYTDLDRSMNNRLGQIQQFFYTNSQQQAGALVNSAPLPAQPTPSPIPVNAAQHTIQFEVSPDNNMSPSVLQEVRPPEPVSSHEEIVIPKTQPVRLPETSPSNEKVLFEQGGQTQQPTIPTQTITAVPAVSITHTNAKTSEKLPFPSKPTKANVVVGMVLEKSGKLIDNAVIEIVDTLGIPVRATKTNSLGQFFSSTPLDNGKYILKIEKDGHAFKPLALALQGKIIDPLEIRSET